MSRSRKKVSVFKDTDSRRCSKRKQYFKRLFNKRVRHQNDLADGNQYRKINDSYELCDYECLWVDKEKPWRGIIK